MDAPQAPPDATVQTVTVTIVHHPLNPSQYAFFVAYQDGDQAWALATRGAGDTYSFPVADPAGRYGTAIGCLTPAFAGVSLFYATVGELATITNDLGQCGDAAPPNTVTVSGTITGTAGEQTDVSYYLNGAVADPVTGAYVMTVYPGTHDLFVVRGAPVDRLAIVRDLAVSADTTVDVGLPAVGFAPVTFGATLPLSGGETGQVQGGFITNGGGLNLGVDQTSPFTYFSIPPAARQPSDVFWAYGRATGTNQSQSVQMFMAAPMDVTLVPAEPITGVSTTVATSQPYIRLGVTWGVYPGATELGWSASQSSVGWSLRELTAGWLAGQTVWEMPDLSAITGWDPRYQLTPGVEVFGNLAVTTCSPSVVGCPEIAGTIEKTAAMAYSMTP